MTARLTYSQHLRAILTLGLPLVGSHIAQIAIVLSDAVMLGWYDVEALAAQVLAGEIFFVLFIFGSGFAWAVMPMVAAAQAAGEEVQVRRVTRMGGWASLGFGVLMLPPMLMAEPILLALGQEPQIAELGGDYLRIAGWAIFPALLVMVLKSYLAAQERTQVVFVVTVAGVALNIVLNYLFIFGNLGFPEMGIRGAALASVIGNFVSFAALAIYAARKLPEHELFVRVWRPDWEAFGQVFRLGWPIGLTSLAESSLFLASSIMMGWIGTVELAAHGIAIQIAAITFMAHLGFSNAATVRAGQAYGRRDPVGLRDGGKVVIMVSAAIALATVVMFLTIPELLIGVFMDPDEPERAAVIAVGVGLLAAAALFQLVDAAQVLALGLLRGVQDTKVPMVIAAISYWAVGVPASYLLGFTFGLGGVGIWLGLAIGLALAGGFLMWRFWGRAVPSLPERS
ncbi:MATE family efflux transporter [Roseovarius sp. 2305UL8-3]|uniref:MATE family efflux transporter n=1 Tax=Roseovarius conchicola TaxID=3121636 RepID=UPI003528B23E